jgi:hypothetical protein
LDTAAAFDEGRVEQFDDIFCRVPCCLCALVSPLYDHLQSPCSHSDSDIIHTAIARCTEEVTVSIKLCASFGNLATKHL